jgi:small conductance mechanosensitive channel
MFLSELLNYLSAYKVDIFLAVGICVVGLFIAYFLKKFLIAIVRKHSKDATVELFIVDVVYIFVLAIILISVLNTIGVPTTSLLTILGAGGLAIALALKDSLSNVASGIMLIFQKPFRIGDDVELANVRGIVLEVTLFNTKIKTNNNELIYLPNSKIIGDKIINKTAKSTKRLVLPFYLSHDTSILHAKACILDVLSSQSKILKNPPREIVVEALEAVGVLIHVRVWVQTVDHSDLQNVLLEKLHEQFQKENIVLAKSFRFYTQNV